MPSSVDKNQIGVKAMVSTSASDGAAIPEANRNADARAEVGEPAGGNEEEELEDGGRVQLNAEDVVEMVDGGGVDDGGRVQLNAEDVEDGARSDDSSGEGIPSDENLPSSCRKIDVDRCR